MTMKGKYSHIVTIEKLELELQKCDFIKDFSNDLLNLIKKTLDPFEDKGYVYDVNQATIVGLYTKLYKHYKLFLRAYNECEYETTILLSRPIYEAFVLMKYLILKGIESQKHYRLVSYRRRYKNLKELEGIDGIGQVMVDKFKYAMNIDGFSLDDFEAENSKKKGQRWNLDGKNFSEIHREVEISEIYSYLYGMLSEIIHSGWGDIRQLHLTHCEGDFFIPKMDFYDNNDTRIIAPIFSMLIEASEEFLTWSERNLEIDSFHEFKRTNELLGQHIFQTYKTNPDKYLFG